MRISNVICFMVVFLSFVSCNKHFLGKEYVLVDGIGGVETLLERQIVYGFDSVYLTSFSYFIKSFTLEVEIGDKKKVFKSQDNILTEPMKSCINNYPDVKRLIFKDFVFQNNKGEIVDIKRNKSIEIIVVDYNN